VKENAVKLAVLYSRHIDDTDMDSYALLLVYGTPRKDRKCSKERFGIGVYAMFCAEL